MYAHITWHTWRRVGCIDERAAHEVRVAIASAGKRTGLQVVKGEVLANHIHLLVSFRPDTRISDFIRLAKSVAATRANRFVVGAVRWARGCYVATIHKSDLPRVIRYIGQQFQRHPISFRGSRDSLTPGASPGSTRMVGTTHQIRSSHSSALPPSVGVTRVSAPKGSARPQTSRLPPRQTVWATAAFRTALQPCRPVCFPPRSRETTIPS